MKIAVIYWSGTGNTESMAKAVAEGARAANAEVELCDADGFDRSTFGEYSGFLFGCPAMGDEELEPSCFEPLFAECEKKLSGMPVGLFGSYGWGGGAWMHIWEQRAKDSGAKLVADGVIAANAPDDDALARCKALGKTLVEAIS